MKVICLIASILLFLCTVESKKALSYYAWRWKADVEISDCGQDQSNCQECLAKSDCVWCLDSSANGECRKTTNCLNRRTTCDSPTLDDQEEKREQEIVPKGVIEPREAQNVTKNASALCAEAGRAGCGSCTKKDFCFWCDSTDSCNSYFNETTAKEACPSGSWYKDQCTYPVGVIPCPKRNRTCDACLSDNLCYWCEAKDECGHYPHEKYTPPHCPSDRVYHKDCPYAGSLLLVLLPILAIILIPVFVYICIWLVCCCMRAAGYDPLPDDSDQGPPGERKHRKGIRLRPGSPSNRTDTLRKKYKLDTP